jgi:hypothetical protein
VRHRPDALEEQTAQPPPAAGQATLTVPETQRLLASVTTPHDRRIRVDGIGAAPTLDRAGIIAPPMLGSLA